MIKVFEGDKDRGKKRDKGEGAGMGTEERPRS